MTEIDLVEFQDKDVDWPLFVKNFGEDAALWLLRKYGGERVYFHALDKTATKIADDRLKKYEMERKEESSECST